MSENKKTLFLLDAFALIYRAHFAMIKNPRVNSQGLNTGPIFGFLNSMLEIITKFKPTHLGVAFDLPEPTVRHIEFKEYKAQRDAQPEEISAALPYIIKILEAWGIPVLTASGYEADDVVGTLAKKAQKEGFEVYMMTLDKDYAQLVDENIFFYKVSSFGKGAEIYDIPKTLEKWGIERIDQVADILGLWGDAVDNIPGIPGIGEKTAKKLIKEYGSVENLVANADKLKGKQQENVINFGEQGILSKKLATIIIDVPIEFEADKLVYNQPDSTRLMPVFQELEFKTFAKRLFGDDAASKGVSTKKQDPAQLGMFGGAATTEVPDSTSENQLVVFDSIETREHDYRFISTIEERTQLITFLMKQKEVCFDTETTSVDALNADMVGMSFCFRRGEAYYVPVPSIREEALLILEEFRAFFENDQITKIGQNVKYDYIILKNYNIEVAGPMFDTMLAHYLLEPDMRHNMDALSEAYLKYTPISIDTLIGKKGKNQGNMADVDPTEVSDYAAEDADITFQLKEILAPQIEERQQTKLLEELEIPLIRVLAHIERNGVKVDENTLNEYSEELGKLSLETEKKIYELAGVEFNIASPKQLGDVLFEKMNLDPKAKKTKTGQYATGEEILAKLAAEHEIVDHILNYREFNKLKSTYVDALPKLIAEDGRIHTSYNQAVAATGRLSSVNPNLQNIPIRTEKGREIRKAFIKGGDDYILFSADYSQIELRIMAAFCQDEHMIDAFKTGKDVHSITASKVFKVPLEEVTREMRGKAKTVNFGIIYGISAFGLSQRINIPRKEAAEIIDNYFLEFPAIKTYMDKIINDARENEYVETILGRRRYLKEINSRNAVQRGFAERNAINAPIQGSAADMIKVAMINIHEWMLKENLKSKMILQVHDELVFDVHKAELELLQEKVPEFMKNAIDFGVPMEIGLGVGDNWLQAH